MKNIWKIFKAMALLGFVSQLSLAVQICNKTDFMCFESGPSQNLSTPYRIDSSGNMYILGTGASSLQSNVVEGLSAVATSNQSSGITNTALVIPVLLSSAVSQGAAIIITSTNVVTNVNGVPSTTTGATTVLGIADTAASSGTIVNVDFSGLALALTTGTVTVGDLLVTSATVSGQGYLATNNSGAVGAVVATALQTEVAGYNGLTRVLLHH